MRINAILIWGGLGLIFASAYSYFGLLDVVAITSAAFILMPWQPTR